MKKITSISSVQFIKKGLSTYLLFNCFIVAGIALIGASSCKKANEATIVGSASSSIIYKTYVVDSLNFDVDSILYDVNNDNVNDIKVTMQHTLNGSTMNYSGSISAVNNNVIFCFIKTNPTWTMLARNDTIKNSNAFNWMPICNYSGSAPFFGSNTWAQGIFTDYFGFKIVLNSKYYYGWFHFKYQAISESGVNSIPDAIVLVGQK